MPTATDISVLEVVEKFDTAPFQGNFVVYIGMRRRNLAHTLVPPGLSKDCYYPVSHARLKLQA